MILYLPVGPPACGKSTLAAAMVLDGLIPAEAIVSPDQYRIICTGSVANQHENGVVFKTCHTILAARLRNGLDVWYDATNLHPGWSAEAVSKAQLYGADVVSIVFDTPDAVCVQRNLERNEPVPADIMAKMLDMRNDLDWSTLPGHVISAHDLIKEQ